MSAGTVWNAWFASGLGPAVLVVARVLGLAMTGPTWSLPGLDWRIRLGLIGLVTVLLFPLVGPSAPAHVTSVPNFAWLALGEFAVGAIMGLTLALVVAAARQAGELVGTQAGLAPAALFDPEGGPESNPLSHLYGLLALGIFVSLDGPARLVLVLAESYQALPLGEFPWTTGTATRVFSRVGWALGLSIQAAAPVAVALVVAGMALGLISRSTSGLALGQLAWPIRSAAGLLLALLGLGTLAGCFNHAFSALFPILARL